MERLNKKGQGLSLTTIILIVLGLAVLIFLIFGFTTGWGNLWGTITSIGGGGANVDDVRRGCEVACAGQSEYAYCGQTRKVTYEDKTWESGSCRTLESGKIKISACTISCTSTVPPLDSSGTDTVASGTKCKDLTPVGRWVEDEIDDCELIGGTVVTHMVTDKSDMPTSDTVCCSA